MAKIVSQTRTVERVERLNEYGEFVGYYSIEYGRAVVEIEGEESKAFVLKALTMTETCTIIPTLENPVHAGKVNTVKVTARGVGEGFTLEANETANITVNWMVLGGELTT